LKCTWKRERKPEEETEVRPRVNRYSITRKRRSLWWWGGEGWQEHEARVVNKKDT